MREAEASGEDADWRRGQRRPLSALRSPVHLLPSPVQPSQDQPRLDGLGRWSSDGSCSDLRGSSDLPLLNLLPLVGQLISNWRQS